MKIENKIKKRIRELNKMKDSVATGGSKARYSFVIAELGFLLED